MSSDALYTLVIGYGVNILLAVVALIAGLSIIGWVTRLIGRKLDRQSVDPSLRSFLVPLAKVTLQILLIISIASVLGLEMTSFIAVLGAASFAVGLALQGSLANFAGGALLLLLKPFAVGDFIEAVGYSGTVQDIQIFYTILNTADNRRIIIPNASLSNASMTNYSHNPTRRVNFEFGVSYADDTQLVKDTLMDIASNHELILSEPAPQVMLGEHGDSAVIFYMRAWCKRQDYWTLYFDVQETVKRQFDEKGISIPYPQMDVHLDHQQ